ncbi:MAG: hypothetical protein HOV97_05090 [Nonomuraea sp.]|nr:hypothetical protein [Nonomuraea sp.]
MSISATKAMVDSFGRTQEENKNRLEIMEAANEDARKNWDNPEWRRDFAQDLTESILLGFEYETLIDRWIETDRTDFNGRVFIREAGGLKAFYMARGGYIEASELTAEISEVPRDMIGVHVWEFEDKFLTNFAESAQTLRDLSIQRMDAEINRRVHTVLAEAVPTGSPYFLATPGLSKPAVDAAISATRDASRSGDVVIVGRPTMVDQIMDFDGFGNETLEEIRNKGVLGQYRGVDIVSLKNYKDEDGAPYLPANEMWIMTRDTGKFAFFGGLKSKEFDELDNWYWHYLARRDTGVLVHHPERARRLVDTSIPA